MNMHEIAKSPDDRRFQTRALEAAIRIGLVTILIWWCFNIVKPFALPFLWGAIFAVALYPLFRKLQALLGGREKLAATLIALVVLALLIAPIVFLSQSLIKNSQTLSAKIQAGSLTIPPPSAKVKTWPLVGARLHQIWLRASTNLDETLDRFKPQLEAAGRKLLSFTAGAGMEIIRFVLAIIVAGVLMVYARGGTRTMEHISARLMGPEKGPEIVKLTGATIRSVAQGVWGVALIQAILAGAGFVAMGVPLTGLWALAFLVLAIVQLPTVVIMGPIIIYVYSVAAPLPATLFAVWSVLVGVSDTFLKPVFLGRGLDIPMLVILLGALSGMILSGIIGLFVGAVVLAVGYKLFFAWLKQDFAREGETMPSEG